ncbi:MAG: tRNA (N(6)-L-threonylcarbamoyladenosine(37)-C(2))-methylthiotransferase MtaB [Deltaproteobacteria bacterium]|nr:tRNA (N(6)-L-threonylcarbamoyladenosine(37)-C(2))-methylthiotransferase MtaB [Deltaproteobacteria bacterium]
MDRRSFLKIAMPTLGCKANQSDAASLAAELSAKGHTIIPFHQAADVYVIHTCTVTQKTDYQSRQLIRRAIARNPAAQVIVTGCYAQVSPENLKAIPGVDFVVGISAGKNIPEIVASGKGAGEARVLSTPAEEPLSFKDGRLPLFPERTRAYLKVQDGCNSLCSYCIVPYARGRSRSLPLQDTLSKAGELSARGFKEIVLTGIHLGAYGEDLVPPISLLHLLQTLERETFNTRIRLSSIEPKEFTPLLIEHLTDSRKICAHLHIPLQSGDDGLLKRMNRNYSAAFFADLVYALKRAIPDLAIGVDVIPGFPGEDEKAFRNTASLLENLPIAYLHVFPFSRRKGTAAVDFPGQIPSQVMKTRCQALRALSEEKRKIFYGSFQGKQLKVLVESKRDRESGLLKGYSRNYIPVLIQGGDEFINQELDVEIMEVRGAKVFGKVLFPAAGAEVQSA